jgi:hypothetical protein
MLNEYYCQNNGYINIRKRFFVDEGLCCYQLSLVGSLTTTPNHFSLVSNNSAYFVTSFHLTRIAIHLIYACHSFVHDQKP